MDKIIGGNGVFTRRGAFGLAAGAGVAATAFRASAMDMSTLSPLGFQAHTLRLFLQRDFAGTLKVMRAMGYEQVELASFPGYVGARQGDFGPLAQMPPAQIKAIVQASGLKYDAAHFMKAQFEPAEFNRSVDWAHGVGLKRMILTGVDVPGHFTWDEYTRALDGVNAIGERVRAAGMLFGVHSDVSMWRTLDGKSCTEEAMRRLDPKLVPIQMDFGTIVEVGADAAAILDRYPGRFYSLHLRDAKVPADSYAYLPASPMGTGDVKWPEVFRAARKAGIKSYVVEMTRAPGGVFDAFKQSYDFMRTLQV